MSPQRLGGSGSRFIRVSKRFSVSGRISAMARQGISCLPKSFENHTNFESAQIKPVSIGLGAVLDAVGNICRRSGLESYAVYLPADSHHRLVFWRQKRPGQKWTCRTRRLLYRGAGPDQFVAGSCCSPYGRVNRCIASKPSGPDSYCRSVDILCNKPFRVLGSEMSL